MGIAGSILWMDRKVGVLHYISQSMYSSVEEDYEEVNWPINLDEGLSLPIRPEKHKEAYKQETEKNIG